MAGQICWLTAVVLLCVKGSLSTDLQADNLHLLPLQDHLLVLNQGLKGAPRITRKSISHL